MSITAFEERLLAAFPKNTWERLVCGLSTGIRGADSLIEATPMLRHALGRDLQGHIRRLGILTTLETMCLEGELPFQAGTARMPKGIWHWLDIKSDRFIAHLARTGSGRTLPDDTANRQTQCLRNNYDLFDDGRIPPVEEVLEEAKVRYSYLTFGANTDGTLTHACIGMPSADETGWLAHFDMLKRDKSSSYAPPPSPPQPDPTQKLRLRRNIDEVIEAERENKKNLG